MKEYKERAAGFEGPTRLAIASRASSGRVRSWKLPDATIAVQ
jgi:hypothetical protein